MCAYLHDSSHPAVPSGHNWMHCSRSLVLSAGERGNGRSATGSSPAEGRGPTPVKCTLSAVTVKSFAHRSGGRWRICFQVEMGSVCLSVRAQACKCFCARMMDSGAWCCRIKDLLIALWTTERQRVSIFCPVKTGLQLSGSTFCISYNGAHSFKWLSQSLWAETETAF